MENKLSEKATLTGRLAALLRQSWLLLLGGAIGIALILWGGNVGEADTKEAETNAAAAEETLADYAVSLEKEIKELCASVRGVGEVQVIVTLEGDFSRIYATNHKEVQTGERTEISVEYVTVGSGSSESAVLLGHNTPVVSGIGIVCRGGNDADVRRELLSLLTAVFGIGANRVYITAGN